MLAKGKEICYNYIEAEMIFYIKIKIIFGVIKIAY